MRRIILIILIIVTHCTVLRAQDIFYSKEQKFTFKNSDFSVVGWCGDRLYTYRSSKEGYYLDAYNDSMRLLATVALDFFPQKIYETHFVAGDNNILVLYQAIQNNQVVQYAALLDSRARLLQKPKALDSVKSAWLATDRKYYSSVVSNDRNKVMVYSVSGRKDGKVQFKTILLDINLNVLGKNSPYIEADDAVVPEQTLLDNEGNFYFAYFETSGAKQQGKSAGLYRVRAEGDNFEYLPLNSEEVYMSGMNIKWDELRKSIYITGFYSSRHNGNIEGLIYGLYNSATNDLETWKQIEFDDKLRLSSGEGNRKRAFNDYMVRDVIIKNDGGFMLLAENYFVTTRTTSYGSGFGYYSWYYGGPYGASSVREYHYGDILVLNYSEDGTLLWRNFIRKDQYSQEDGGMFSSYAMLNSGASIVFLYNDFTTNRSTLSLAAIDGEGNLQMKRMDQGRGAGGDWIPRAARQTDIRELVVPVLKRNNLLYSRVAF